MNEEYENLTVFEQVRAGLHQGIEHARGQLTLRTTRLPAPPPPMSRHKVARLRKELGMSQHVFAAVLNVSPKLVQSWEQGNRRPAGGNLRLLQIVQSQPKVADVIVQLHQKSQRRGNSARHRSKAQAA